MSSIASLEKIFPSRPFTELLLFFILHPKEETYVARIVRATGNALIQVQRGLKRLESTGLIIKKLRGNKAYYQANYEHSVFKDLKRVVLKAVIFSDPLNKELLALEEKIQYGFVFGSTARDTDSAESDLDLMLIGDLTLEEVENFTFVLSQELGKEVNVIIYSVKAIKKKIKEKNSFISEVILESKIWLIGNENEFKKIFR